MTESVTGYRTLAQLGVASPVPAHGESFAPAGSFAPAWTPEPAWSPLITRRPGTSQQAMAAAIAALPFHPGPTIAGVAPTSDALQGASDASAERSPGLDLPSPRRVLTEGSREILEFHPYDPKLRMTGQHRHPPGGVAERPDGEAKSSGGERSGGAKAAIIVGIGGGFVMNGIDVVRTVKKYPEALRAAKFDPSLGRLGRLPLALGLTLKTRPDSRLVDPALIGKGPASVANLGKSFDKFDEIAMKSSVVLGTALAGLQIATAIPNLIDALGKDGPWYEDLAMSTSGRAGVLQMAGGTLGVGLFGAAWRQTSAAAGPKVIDKLMAAAKAPFLAKPLFTNIGLGSAALVMANELGYFDFLNNGEKRPTRTALREAAHRTPLLNDQEFRTGGLLAAAGVVGYKSSRAIQAAGGLAAGGLAGLGKGHLIGGAVVAGLLGAQMLGGLDVLNKSAAPAVAPPRDPSLRSIPTIGKGWSGGGWQ